MSIAEKKVSLVGWGVKQVVLHVFGKRCGISVFDSRLTLFGETPWLSGLVVILPVDAKYVHGMAPAPEHRDMVLAMRDSAVEDAIEAVKSQNIRLLGEAVSTTYMAQQYMGGEMLPDLGEVGRRFSGDLGVFLFEKKTAISKQIRDHAVLLA